MFFARISYKRSNNSAENFLDSEETHTEAKRNFAIQFDLSLQIKGPEALWNNDRRFVWYIEIYTTPTVYREFIKKVEMRQVIVSVSYSEGWSVNA